MAEIKGAPVEKTDKQIKEEAFQKVASDFVAGKITPRQAPELVNRCVGICDLGVWLKQNMDYDLRVSVETSTAGGIVRVALHKITDGVSSDTPDYESAEVQDLRGEFGLGAGYERVAFRLAKEIVSKLDLSAVSTKG